MEEIRSPNAIYNHRRRSRGGHELTMPALWRRRLVFGGIILGAVIVIGAGIIIWWLVTRVTLMQARVCGAVVSLSPEITARARELCVVPGDHVTRGQALIRLDDTGLQAALSEAESAHQQEVTSLSLIDKTASAEMDLAKARIAEATAARDEARSRLSLLKKGARREDLEIAKVRVASAVAQAKLAEMELRQSEELLAKGVDSPFTVETMKTALASKANLQREAELTLDRLTAGPSADEIEAAANALAARDASLAICQAQLKQAEARQYEVALQREKVKAVEATVAGARAAAAKTVIESPVEGTVIRTSTHVGELCPAGTPVIRVANDSAGWWIEGYVRERDAAKVREKQRAYVDVIDGEGTSFRAVVDAVGLSTSSMGTGSEAAAGPSSAASATSQTVWVRLRPDDVKIDPPRLGLSARATIVVR